MRMALPALGFCSLVLVLLAEHVSCSAAGGSGFDGAGAAGGGVPFTTTVSVSVTGVGEVDVTGKSTTEPCARDSGGTVTGTCSTAWGQGDPPTLIANEKDPAWHFQAWVDPPSGKTLGTMPKLPVTEGSMLQVEALFLQESSSSSSSTGTCGGQGCGCVNNVCPDTVAEGLASVANLVERGADLYYLAGTVDKVPKAGGKPTTIVNGVVGSFTVDDASVFWVDGTGAALYKANLDGTGTTKLTGLDSIQYPHVLAVDDTSVYVTLLANKGMGSCVTVQRMPKDGSAKLAEVANACDFLDVAKPFAIALNGTDVFWGTVLTPKGGGLYSAPKTGNAVTAKQLASNANSPVTRVVADDATVFYLQNGIRMIDAKNPGMPTQVGTSMMSIASFTADATSVFVAGGAGISRVDRMSQKETLLASDPGSTIAVDATDVYFATGSPPAVKILKIAK